ncbi:proline-rich protein 19 isoform X2 [Phacochoerus africanus]|nr:proline-rich protein 19 isoform X2 [Phacochoerus africanus]XP_047650239.1 proline-rich protein 19 isoform X2 [Phacochoerus africanus]XP_047650240.1 proline-rich protein 19 isoform X2 [Phacochoerus africanus]XP_047650241.1 proline-rich protein 19 isoform X2 [Phacochoerus africanus]XP_047650242.1 proline-rich protein 19 isoform X2 [Phacochoerus africanus]
MDPKGPTPKPFQRPEKPGRVRRWKTRRERNEALMGSRRPLAHQDPSLASRDPHVVLRNSVAPSVPKLVVITQGRLSREHRGLFNHEVKSLDVARLLSSGSLEPSTPALPIRSSPSPDRAQERALQSRGKENQVLGGSGPGPPSPPQIPSLGQLLVELQCQLVLPQAFPRRNLVQEARDAIVSTLQACHGCVPDLTLVLRGCQPHLPETQPAGPERQKMTSSWIHSPEQALGERRQRGQLGTKELTFAMPHNHTPTVDRASLARSKGPWPPPSSLLPSPSGVAWGPPTAFDLLKSIWLIATPPPSRPWGVGPPHPLTQPPSPLLSRTSALDWSPSPPAPLPSLSWVVAQSSPEAWSFPPMRLY